jgi:ribokinase
VRVACLGDVTLDVLVSVPAGLVADDDTAATITFTTGGQAANVAAWLIELGGVARVFGPRSDTAPGRLVEQTLTERGIQPVGPVVDRTPAVMSLVSGGTRSMASDPGDSSWLDAVAPGPWLTDADWLFVSGYALLRARRPHLIVETAAAARRTGARVAVDLASAAMIDAYGARRFAALWRSLEPAVVFGNDVEWVTCAGTADGGWVAVRKHGPGGTSFVRDEVVDHRVPPAGPVIDVTGAGDALAAGYLLGGADLAMRTAARCVAQVGAQPVQAP